MSQKFIKNHGKIIPDKLLSAKLLKRMGFNDLFINSFTGDQSKGLVQGKAHSEEIVMNILSRVYQLRILRRELLMERTKIIKSVNHKYDGVADKLLLDIIAFETVASELVKTEDFNIIKKRFNKAVDKDKLLVDRLTRVSKDVFVVSPEEFVGRLGKSLNSKDD